MNAWSAHDVQKKEYVLLGLFTSKNFASTGRDGGLGNPMPLEYLRDSNYHEFSFVMLLAPPRTLSSTTTGCVVRVDPQFPRDRHTVPKLPLALANTTKSSTRVI
jgi:hypothetical protein